MTTIGSTREYLQRADRRVAPNRGGPL